MVSMSENANAPDWRALSQFVRRIDEDRWISSRYAPSGPRQAMTGLYAFNYELAKVRTIVSEPGLGAIRFQWWRDALDEIEAGKPARAHDVARAVADLVQREKLSPATLRRLIDGHETAFEVNDRAQEPEAFLMSAAAQLLSSRHGWGLEIKQLAPAYAAARRRDTKAHGPVLPKAPPVLRSAVAHARLRHAYADGLEPGRLKKRMTIMRAVMSGQV